LPNVRSRQVRQDALLRAALSARRGVVIDNTNVSPAGRRAMLAIARAQGAEIIAIACEQGARVIGYYVEASTREAIARNEKRDGRAKVPKVAIFTCAKRLVPHTPEQERTERH